MKIFLFVSTALLLIVSSINAQTKRHYIAISVGPSIPLGAFAKSDAGTFGNWNNTSGFANTEIVAGAEGAYYITPKLGIAASLYYSSHGGFSAADAKKLGDSYTDAFAVDYSTVSTRGSYSSLNFLVGPQFSFPVNRFTIDVRALAGIVKSFSTPEMTVQLEDADEATFSQKSSNASAFGYQIGTGFRYALTNQLSFIFRADYFNSKGLKIENENRSANAGRLVTNQPLSWINTSVGLAFSLGKDR